ncbi:MAG: hypothetical protein E7Z87_05845 [Cyanobacteria bacterium SIG26]|nr:hypothetical protein [Cyanobacteria bacterium SIG26]
MNINCTKYLPVIPPNTYKQIARNAATALDNSLSPKYTLARAKYTKLLEHTTYHPTLGMIAQHEVFKTKTKDFPLNFELNLNKLKQMPSIKYLQKILDNRIQELYPKTAKIRQYIITNDRIQLDKVTKSKGYSIFDKLKILIK